MIGRWRGGSGADSVQFSDILSQIFYLENDMHRR